MNPNHRLLAFAFAVTALPLGAQSIQWTFTPTHVRGAGAPPVHSCAVTLADMSGDGLLDLVSVHAGNQSVSIHDNDGAGGFPFNNTANSVVADAWDVVTADLDAGNRRDVVVAQRFPSNSIAVGLSSTTAGAYGFTSSTHATGGDTIAVLEFDVDGDGDRDIAALTRTPNAVVVFRNELQSGAYSLTSFTVPLAVFPLVNAFGTGDFNGDALPDLAVAFAGFAGAQIFLNTTSPRDGSATPSFAAPTLVTAGNDPVSITTGDWNRDGFCDLAFANAGSADISILQNSGLVLGWPGSVAFTAQPSFAFDPGAQPTAIACGDYGRDGDLDLWIVMRPSSFSPSINFTIVGNDGNGGFTSSIAFATGPTPVDIAVADVDATVGDVDSDQVLEAVTANWDGDQPSPDQDLTLMRSDVPGGTCCHDFLAGVDDAFVTTVAPFSEISCPRAPLAAWLAPRRDFDGAALANLGFGHTFMQLPERIVDAKLTLSVRWNGANNLNDSLSLAWDGGVFGPLCWTVPLSQLIKAVGNNVSGVVTLDLGSLPGGMDLRPWLNATGMLDVAIADDTLVDHLHLHLVTACPGGCSCAGEEAELGLSVTPLVLGGVANFTITGAPPFSITALLFGGGVGCSGFDGLCLDPYAGALAVVMADGNGTANYPVTLPTGLLLPPCMLIHTQAVAIDPPLMGMHWSCTLSTYTYAN